jgi:hypothetical protein
MKQGKIISNVFWRISERIKKDLVVDLDALIIEKALRNGLKSLQKVFKKQSLEGSEKLLF